MICTVFFGSFQFLLIKGSNAWFLLASWEDGWLPIFSPVMHYKGIIIAFYDFCRHNMFWFICCASFYCRQVTLIPVVHYTPSSIVTILHDHFLCPPSFLLPSEGTSNNGSRKMDQSNAVYFSFQNLTDGLINSGAFAPSFLIRWNWEDFLQCSLLLILLFPLETLICSTSWMFSTYFSGCAGNWDNITCWRSAEIGETVTVPCPKIFSKFFSKQGIKMSFCNLDWCVSLVSVCFKCWK